MSVKTIELPSIGIIKIQKRKNTRRIKLRINQKQEIVVSQPTWLPFAAGIEFARSQTNWLLKHRKETALFQHGQVIGKDHTLFFIPETGRISPRVTVTSRDIRVYHSPSTSQDSDILQSRAKQGARRALVKQGDQLIDRLTDLAAQYDAQFTKVHCRFMVSKWGSRRSDGTITLNYRLLDLPDELIDYVIIHELAHIKHMNHSPIFWAYVEELMPDYRIHRRALKKIQLSWQH